MSYQWSLQTLPPGSLAALSDPQAAAPTAFSRTIGAGLQLSGEANLGFTNHGGDGSIVRIAQDRSTAGSEYIELFVADGVGSVAYTVQGVAGAAGSVTVTASAPGFTDGSGMITVVQPAVAITGLASSRTAGSNDPFTVLFGIPNGSGTGLSGIQETSAGSDPPLVLTLESDDGAVGQLTLDGTTAATVMQELAAGIIQAAATFVPLVAGQTTVTASIPGFLSTTAAIQEVTVTDP